MFLELIIGLVILSIALYLIWKNFNKPFSFEKFINDGKSVVLIKVNKHLKRVALIDQADGEKLTFARNSIEKGDLIKFVYQASQDPALLIIDDELGTHKFKLEVNQYKA